MVEAKNYIWKNKTKYDKTVNEVEENIMKIKVVYLSIQQIIKNKERNNKKKNIKSL